MVYRMLSTTVDIEYSDLPLTLKQGQTNTRVEDGSAETATERALDAACQTRHHQHKLEY